MCILSGCYPRIDSFITYWVIWIFNFDSKMGGIETILLIRNKFSQFVWYLSKLISIFQANWSEGVDGFVKVQFARTYIFIAEAVDVVFAVRLVIFACRDLQNYRISYWTTVSVDDLEIDITIACFRYFTCFSKMTVKERSTSSNRKFLIENLMN
jgi:hypothetical protein